MPTIVRLQSGTEGPRHDPYGWQEITVERNGHCATIHYSGLYDDWLEVDGIRFEAREVVDYVRQRFDSQAPEGLWLLRRIFAKVMGYNPKEFEEAQAKAD